MRILRRGPSRIGGILNGVGPTSFGGGGGVIGCTAKKHSHNQAFLLRRVPLLGLQICLFEECGHMRFSAPMASLLLECDTSPKAVRCVWFRVWKV